VLDEEELAYPGASKISALTTPTYELRMIKSVHDKGIRGRLNVHVLNCFVLISSTLAEFLS